jgi:hypothetical protein
MSDVTVTGADGQNGMSPGASWTNGGIGGAADASNDKPGSVDQAFAYGGDGGDGESGVAGGSGQTGGAAGAGV